MKVECTLSYILDQRFKLVWFKALGPPMYFSVDEDTQLWPKKLALHTVSILTGHDFYTSNSVMSTLIGTKFAAEMYA